MPRVINSRSATLLALLMAWGTPALAQPVDDRGAAVATAEAKQG